MPEYKFSESFGGCGVELRESEDSDVGVVVVTLAQLPALSRNGFRYQPGIVESEQYGILSAHDHDAAHHPILNPQPKMPVGVSRIYEEDESLKASLRYNLKGKRGRKAYDFIRFAESQQPGTMRWSFSGHATKAKKVHELSLIHISEPTRPY